MAALLLHMRSRPSVLLVFIEQPAARRPHFCNVRHALLRGDSQLPQEAMLEYDAV